MEPIKIMQSFVITSYFITFTFSYEGKLRIEQCMAGTLGNNREHGHFILQALWQRLSTKGPVPQGRSSHGFVIIDHRAYVFGGENSPRVPIGSTVHCLDLSTQEWSVCQPQNKDSEPQPINVAAVAALVDSMYVFGGRSGLMKPRG